MAAEGGLFAPFLCVKYAYDKGKIKGAEAVKHWRGQTGKKQVKLRLQRPPAR